MPPPSPVKSDWAIGDDYDPTAANDVAVAVNYLLANPGSGATQIFGEIPSGTQDGTNETLTLANDFVTGSTCVYRNGLRERLGVGYTESSPTIVFAAPPLSSDVIEVDYQIS
jgi:hypothetical protein